MTIPAKDLLRDVESFAQDIRWYIEQGYTIKEIKIYQETLCVHFINKKGATETAAFSAWDD